MNSFSASLLGKLILILLGGVRVCLLPPHSTWNRLLSVEERAGKTKGKSDSLLYPTRSTWLVLGI